MRERERERCTFIQGTEQRIGKAKLKRLRKLKRMEQEVACMMAGVDIGGGGGGMGSGGSGRGDTRRAGIGAESGIFVFVRGCLVDLQRIRGVLSALS